MRLDLKYQPSTIDEFAGLAGPRAILNSFAAEPYASSWLLLGPSGLGKSTIALALCNRLGAELIHIKSKSCNLASVNELMYKCNFVPMTGGYWFVLVDEADQMTKDAQLAFLSALDTTEAPPNAIFVFTANDTEKLEDRFVSRCRRVVFKPEAAPAIALLERIWKAETEATPPDFVSVLHAAGGNIREALMTLEVELIAPGTFEPEMIRAKSEPIHLVCGTSGFAVDKGRSAAAKRAWITIRKNRARQAKRARAA